jgi:dipeptidyl aminopeptidase/acylaminoacyl peptidase
MVHCTLFMSHHTNPMWHFKLRRNTPHHRAPASALCLLIALLAPLAAQAQVSLSGSLLRQDLASPDAAVSANLPAYLESRSASFVDWLPDGSMLVATRFGEQLQVHRVRAALGMREQLSFEPAGVIDAAAQPAHEAAFLMLSQRDGGRHSALLLERPNEHRVLPLTDGVHRDSVALWAHDGRRLAFSSDRITAREREVYVLDSGATAATPALVAGGPGYRWTVFDWSLDDARLLLGREPTSPVGDVGDSIVREAELYIADILSGELTPLQFPRRTEGKTVLPAAAVAARAARFAADGRGVLLLSMSDGSDAAGGTAFRQLRYFDPATGSSRALSSESTHDVERFDQSPDGHYVAYTLNEGGNSRLVLIDQQRKLDMRVATLAPGLISTLKFDASSKRLALTLESARAPADVYVLEADSQLVTRWTQSELGLLDPARLVQPTLLQFPTWDRIDGQARSLSAYGYRSNSAPSGLSGERPVMILLRSGGGTEFRPAYDACLQYLVNEMGFVVLAPNVRGSAGFGQSFLTLGTGTLRNDAVRDVGSLLVWIGLQRELDRNRVFVMGEGYGSYLALSALAQYGDRLRGGSAAFLPHMGPLATAATIGSPVLLVQGQGDPEAPAYESEQLAARLRANGAAVQFLAAADESGPFRAQSNREAYCFALANFLAPLVR